MVVTIFPPRAPRGPTTSPSSSSADHLSLAEKALLGWNAYVNAHRAPVERSISVLKVRWRALKHVTLDPSRIGALIAAVLMLTRTEKAY